MDGGRRLLQPLKGAWPLSASARPAPAGGRLAAASAYPMDPHAFDDEDFAPRSRRAPRRRWRRSRFTGLLSALTKPGAGVAMAALLIGSTVVYGAVRGGQYETFTAEYGAPADLLARAVGLRLDAITISGQRELAASEILEAAGVSDRNSLLWLDAHAVRERLKANPLIKDADVRKLYPNRLMIDVAEREPYALWQKDGRVVIISADGMVIDEMRDGRFAELPFVVGDNANARVGEFMKIMEAAGDLRGRVRAGILVAQRRWNLKMSSGIDVKLPEADPMSAVATLARLQREGRILEKDILTIDMRLAGRVAVRLSEDAAAARADALAKKPRGKGGTT